MEQRAQSECRDEGSNAESSQAKGFEPSKLMSRLGSGRWLFQTFKCGLRYPEVSAGSKSEQRVLLSCSQSQEDRAEVAGRH
jgi:hypothetical protein